MIKKIYIGGDHVCFENRQIFIDSISEKYKDIQIINIGSFSSESVDYPDYAFKLAELVSKDNNSIGIITCGSAIGVSICCNKVKNIRAAVGYNKEVAKLSRQHNNCNIICLANRFNSIEDNIEIIYSFIDAEFEKGRHERRVNKIIDYEQKN